MFGKSNRSSLAGWIRLGRWTLLMIAAFSTVNCVLLLTGTSTYFLFSAMLPLNLVMNGCYHTDWFSGAKGDPYPGWYFGLMVVIALLAVAVYAVCYLLSVKRPVIGLTAGLIWLALDTLTMPLFLGFALPVLREYLIHGLLLVLLALALIAQRRLDRLPSEDSPSPPLHWTQYEDEE